MKNGILINGEIFALVKVSQFDESSDLHICSRCALRVQCIALQTREICSFFPDNDKDSMFVKVLSDNPIKEFMNHE